MTPGAEFNTYADSVAAARVYALTSPNPKTTMPPVIAAGKKQLPPYPENLSKKLKVKLFPLDITERHLLPRSLYTSYTSTSPFPNSPLTQWTNLFLTSTFAKILSLSPSIDPATLGLQLHDPLTIWYCITRSDPGWEFIEDQDLRVETAGQWTRGVCVVDRRGRGTKTGEGDLADEVVGDAGGWGDTRRGNRVGRAVESPGAERFAGEILERIFGKV